MAQDTTTKDDELLDDLYGLSDDLVDSVRDEIRHGKTSRKLRALLRDMHGADIADLLEHLSSAERHFFIEKLGKHLDSEVVANLDEAVLEEVLEDLTPKQIVGLVRDLESDDAVEVIESLDDDAQRDVLDAIAPAERRIFEESLSYPEDTAGRIMQREVCAQSCLWTVGQSIDFMRKDSARKKGGKNLPERFYNIIVINQDGMPMGLVPLSTLMGSPRDAFLVDLMDGDIKSIPTMMEQEDVAFLFRQYGLTEAPVVDDNGVLQGIINIDDIVHVLEEEHEEDLLHLGGISEDDFYSDVMETVGSRAPWLFVNLITAILASLVIGIFADTIEQAVALAILMPIVASMGGNAGTQTLTIAVRALATNELTPSNALRVVGKEVLVGLVNGVLFACVTGALAWWWFDDVAIGMIIAMAMIINLLVAGLAGTLIPLTLERKNLDPAISSTVFLTTVTDVVGFLTFLFLATVIL